MYRRTLISGIIPTYLLLKSTPLLATLDKQHITCLYSDKAMLAHHIQADHPESPARLEYIIQALGHHYQPLTIAAEDVHQWIAKLHTEQHIQAIQSKYPVAHHAATTAVRCALSAVDAVFAGDCRNAFCAVRPPGHHALNSGQEEGFCYYNTVAIAARYAQMRYAAERILIVDWDYHHGNATEAMFYSDPSVLFFSTHDASAYPGTGHPNKQGEGEGLGYNINIHLPCGSRDELIIEAFERLLIPAAKQFKPDLILVSAGFDSRQDDLLGCFDITDQGFVRLTQIVKQLAHDHCHDRLISLLEGGYTLAGLQSAVISHIDELDLPFAT